MYEPGLKPELCSKEKYWEIEWNQSMWELDNCSTTVKFLIWIMVLLLHNKVFLFLEDIHTNVYDSHLSMSAKNIMHLYI